MCGVAGVVRSEPYAQVPEEALLRMARALRHRGPDGYGIALGRGCGLVSTRLAIVDLEAGWQPMVSEVDGSVLVYNGEVYNHPELRAGLVSAGEACRTSSDTEAVLRLLVREGLAALHRFNGQFALARWEPGPRRLTLVRDRFGVRPLLYALLADGSIVFASEAKGLFASGEVQARPCPEGVDDVFTGWGALAPTTVFEGVKQLAPGHALVWESGRVVSDGPWWTADLRGDRGAEGDLEELLQDSVRLRLRADVTVGTYLSGGLDSSLLTALAAEASAYPLKSFSVAFQDAHLDERAHQERVAALIGTDHHVVDVRGPQIARAFRAVIRSVESPVVRTAPVPMYLLARAAREHGVTVVATGEGADELFWGYDLFKELAIRHAGRADASAWELADQLYPYLATGRARRGPGWRDFFEGAGPVDDLLASHQTRTEATGFVKRFYSPEFAAAVGSTSSHRLRSRLPSEFVRWGPLQRAEYLELRTLLDPYLLSAQGDRVAMAHGVEGRYPFLDHRVFEHAAALPDHRKLDGLRDKVALREVAERRLPAGIAHRAKQPYRAPQVAPFVGAGHPAWVDDALSAECVRAVGVFDPATVAGLVARCAPARTPRVREEMAFVGILSTQVWFEEFCGPSRCSYPLETRAPRVRVELRADASAVPAARA